MMGLLRDEKTVKKMMVVIPRWMKTLLFLINMVLSLLLFSAAPILLIAADALIPSACFSAALSPSSLTLQTFSSLLTYYDFRRSLVDIPLLSLTRSLIIFCVYSLCDGPRLWRGPYMAAATVCSAASLVFLSLKGSYVFMMRENHGGGGGFARAMEVALFGSSAGLAVGHVVVAYRVSCRERRKLLVFKIDIEAVSSSCKNRCPRYHQKIFQTLRKSKKIIYQSIYIHAAKSQVRPKDGFWSLIWVKKC